MLQRISLEQKQNVFAKRRIGKKTQYLYNLESQMCKELSVDGGSLSLCISSTLCNSICGFIIWLIHNTTKLLPLFCTTQMSTAIDQVCFSKKNQNKGTWPTENTDHSGKTCRNWKMFHPYMVLNDRDWNNLLYQREAHIHVFLQSCMYLLMNAAFLWLTTQSNLSIFFISFSSESNDTGDI